MNKIVKRILILLVAGIIIATGIYFFLNMTTSNMDEYSVSGVTVPSINTVVDKREVIGISSRLGTDASSKTIQYTSNTVKDDLIKYINYLKDHEGFSDNNQATDLSKDKGSIQLTKNNQSVILKIDYDNDGYDIQLQVEK